LMDLMRELNHRLGLTFLFSTHDQRLLDRADRIVRLCDGRVVENTKEREVSDAQVSAAGF
jgi:putative ABC transport system ATP-binding protein